MKHGFITPFLLATLLLPITSVIITANAQQYSINIISIEAPSQVSTNQRFAIRVTVQYSFTIPIRAIIHVYEHAGPLLACAEDNLSGSDSKTYSLAVIAPPVTNMAWQLNIHAFYDKPSAVHDIKSIYISVTPIITTSLGINLIKNGDFSQPLEPYWKKVKLKEFLDYPRIDVDLEKGRLAMDLPWNTSGYVYQEVNIPEASQVVLSLRVWGAEVRTIARIVVEDSSGEHDVDWFLVQVLEGWGGIPYVKTYNLTEFAGQKITLKIYGSGEYRGQPAGQWVYVDDVRIEAATGRQSVIVRHILPKEVGRTPADTGWIGLGEAVKLAGRLYPVRETTVQIEYKHFRGYSYISSVRTDSLGRFQDAFIPNATGIWTATVFWSGDTDYDGSSSPPAYFAVCSRAGIELESLIVNGVLVHNLTFPQIEAKPNENLSGKMEIVVQESFQFTAVLVIGVNSWEKDRYDAIGGQNTQPAEELDLKISWFNPPNYTFIPTHRDLELGNFIVRMRYDFPLNISSSPTYITPSEEGVYYLIVTGGGVNYVWQLTGPINLLGKERRSIWTDVSSEEWEHFLPRNRNQTTGYHILAIRVRVVDVDHAMRNANLSIVLAEKNEIDVTNIKEIFSAGMKEYYARNFSYAKELFLKAENASKQRLNRLIQEINSKISVFNYISFCKPFFNLIDFFDFTNDVDQAKQNYAVDNYRVSKKFIDNALMKLGASLLIVGVTLIIFVLCARFVHKSGKIISWIGVIAAALGWIIGAFSFIIPSKLAAMLWIEFLSVFGVLVIIDWPKFREESEEYVKKAEKLLKKLRKKQRKRD